MAPESHDSSGSTVLGLDERILSALQTMHGRIAFSGLRRALRAHPESLARALRRLEREGLVERLDGGYRALGGGGPVSATPATRLRSIASIGLPPGTPSESVYGRLSGRWFGDLRWVGVVERPDGRLLAWARRDGTGPVLVGIRKGMLQVYTSDLDRDDPNESEDAAYELLVHAVGAVRATGARGLDAAFLRPAASVAAPEYWLDN
jgi:hypothetical protein